MVISRKIQKLLDQRKKVDKEIEEIQTNCRHDSRHMRFIYPNPKSQLTELRWVCEYCEKPISIPTDKELKKFLTNK